MRKTKKMLLTVLATLSIGAGIVWLSSCADPMPGPQGEKGEQGIQGVQGEKGEDGKTPVITIGENGNWFIDGVDTNVSALGEKGDKGDQGEKGDNGKDGQNGQDGQNGTDGKDGVSVVDVQITYGTNDNGDSVMIFNIYLSNESTIVEEVVIEKEQETSEGKKASEGLEYTLSADGTYYIVTGVGLCVDREVVIPSVYEGKPVKEIDEAAFEYCFDITSVIISEGITTIGANAFAGCERISSVQLPNSLLYIQERAFYYCKALPMIEFSNNLISIGEYAFCYCDSLTVAKLPNSLTSIGANAFRMTGLRSIRIPQNVTVIGNETFACDYKLKSVELPSGLTTIGSNIFDGCSRLEYVYYRGTAETWAEIVLNTGNTALAGKTVYYYSAAQPTMEGNYWHYDENGEIVVWEVSKAVVTDTFESEYTYFDPDETFLGWTGTARGKYSVCNKYVGDTKICYMGYVYKKGTTITYKINASKAVENVTLKVNLATVYKTNVTFGPTGEYAWKVVVNGVVLDYTPFTYDGVIDTIVESDLTGEFKTYTLSTTVSLKEGENVIEFVTDNENGVYGTMQGFAPVIDYIQLITDENVEFSYEPIYENLE